MIRYLVALSTALLLLQPSTALAADRVLDLSKPAGTKISITAPPGEIVTFLLINTLAVGKPYTVTIEERAIPIPEFTKPSGLSGTFADAACDAILTNATALETAADEAAVGELTRKIRSALSGGACTDPAKLNKINEWLSKTVHPLPGSFPVRAGAEIVLTVTREDKVWTLVISGGPRGLWLTTCNGVSVVPNKDERYFAKAIGENTFTITPERDLDDVRMIPAVFFSWLPRNRMLGSLAVGPTAGIGLSKDRAAIFAGVGVTYNWNLGFVAGLAVAPHSVLKGQYSSGDEITGTLDSDQLNQTVFRTSWVVAFTFRFGSNPFGAGDQETKESKPATGAGEEKKKAGAGSSPSPSELRR